MIRIIIWLKPYAKYLLAFWLITIITFSSIPSLPTLKIHTDRADIRLDYLIHFCEYGLLAFITFLAFASSELKISHERYFYITLFLLAFAVLDEFHQKFIPGRTFNPKDILGNILGIVAALGFCILVFGNIARRLRDHN
ncbi:MAG: VanZ family protein [Bacteroidales bacterium]|nr:VanZ family protein [Bacteroidales bacterium]